MHHALVACSPDGAFIAFAHGKRVRLFNTRQSKFVPLGNKAFGTEGKRLPHHTGVVRVVKFDKQSSRLLTCGDDKLVFVWNCVRGTCIGQKLMPKKLSAGQFGPDGRIVVADKTGDVYSLAPISEEEEKTMEKGNKSIEVEGSKTAGSSETNGNKRTGGDGTELPDAILKQLESLDEMKTEFLLGHCATVTDMQMLKIGGKNYLATADVEKKIRISLYPDSYDIVSFCFGHKAFVTRTDWAPFKTHDGAKIPLLLSGAGDGTVRLWEPKTGRLLDTWKLEPVVSGRTDATTPTANAAASTESAPCNGATTTVVNADVPKQSGAGGKRPAAAAGLSSGSDKNPDNPDTTGAVTVGCLAVSQWQSLAAVWRLGDSKIEILRVSEGALKPHSVLPVCNTPLSIAFDPQAHLWVLVLMNDAAALGVEVYGMREDGESFVKLEMTETLQGHLFENLDISADSLMKEYIRSHNAKATRKKMRVDKNDQKEA
mmetsp:Transcript_26672/g.37128  ORF Transcript_26672/g.37128 Transcript_26672/m.37128 type:complete len:485 (-) Transcript_26672:370-1824(-)|eukprot:CAMPEP_0184481150 /NCGR_PEP_ID=MMETSP0113_2-20130426/2684_1 /TAXON_ID=91329 /ORGANISM="Norrisiella sphaerica, Strain BC52" /LENGTH=484 /DNA_ID=CAMNT_0026860083 /DNA_START=389 /DNA_END=1843 /DNA_ORIENTATION=+